MRSPGRSLKDKAEQEIGTGVNANSKNTSKNKSFGTNVVALRSSTTTWRRSSFLTLDPSFFHYNIQKQWKASRITVKLTSNIPCVTFSTACFTKSITVFDKFIIFYHFSAAKWPVDDQISAHFHRPPTRCKTSFLSQGAYIPTNIMCHFQLDQACHCVSNCPKYAIVSTDDMAYYICFA